MTSACATPVAQEGRSPRGRASLTLAPPEGAFVGRDRELGELVAAVTSGARRVWIAAASGVGKTELLGQLVGRCRERGWGYHWLAPHEPTTPATRRRSLGPGARLSSSAIARSVAGVVGSCGASQW